METTRKDGRGSDQLRPVSITLGMQVNPEGSVLYRCGGTLVLISASVEETLPPWLKGQGRGWVTAEYAMHPRANRDRQRRDRTRGSVDGRTAEIQRLIARSLRAAVRLEKLGERMITVDCDVLDADGGTRTASITGRSRSTACARWARWAPVWCASPSRRSASGR
jgi:ribonuclease PH